MAGYLFVFVGGYVLGSLVHHIGVEPMCRGSKKKYESATPIVSPKDCKHEDFWFDRSVSYCPFCKDEHMNDVCCECGLSSCAIRLSNKVDE